jgi:hypothetical protein
MNKGDLISAVTKVVGKKKAVNRSLATIIRGSRKQCRRFCGQDTWQKERRPPLAAVTAWELMLHIDNPGFDSYRETIWFNI